MAIDKYLDKIDDALEEAWSLPFTGGKRMIDIEKVRELVDAVRLHLPQEIKDAKAIVADREEIISDAKLEAEDIIKKAEERARNLVAQEEVLVVAQAKAGEALAEAHQKAKAAERAAIEYSEDTLKRAEAALLSAYTEIKNTRSALRNKVGAAAQAK